ncbi:glycosyltransferase family 4 protein [bacterium]|nr:glycosyltransferase family 4 protein [bacterium]
MHILLFHMYYLRAGDSGNTRFNDFCRLWLEQDPDLRITVFTGSVNHYTGELHSELGEAACFEHPDLSAGEHAGRVRVVHVRQPGTYGKGFAGKAWSQVQWSRNCQRLLRDWPEKPDVIVATSPPLWAAEPLLPAKRRWGIPAVVEERDLWPESIVQLGLAPAWHPAVRYLAWLERRLVRGADHFVGVVRTSVNSIVERGLKPREQCSMFTNGIWLPRFDDVDPGARERIRAELGIASGQVVCMYIGQMGRFQRVMDIVDIADRLRHREDIEFLVMADGPEREEIVAEAGRRNLPRLRFLPLVPADEVPAWLSVADIGIGLLNSTGNINWNSTTSGVIPGKMYDYAGARLPVVFNAHGLPRDMIEQEAGGGIFASTVEQFDDFCAAITRLADDPQLRTEMGMRNYEGMAVKYNKQRMADGYLALLRDLVSRGRS